MNEIEVPRLELTRRVQQALRPGRQSYPLDRKAEAVSVGALRARMEAV
jgi:hypothetical protein